MYVFTKFGVVRSLSENWTFYRYRPLKCVEKCAKSSSSRSGLAQKKYFRDWIL